MTHWEWYFFGDTFCLCTLHSKKTQFFKYLNDLGDDLEAGVKKRWDASNEGEKSLIKQVEKTVVEWPGGERNWPQGVFVSVQKVLGDLKYLEGEMIIYLPPTASSKPEIFLIWPFDFQDFDQDVLNFRKTVKTFKADLCEFDTFDPKTHLLANTVFGVLDRIVEAVHASPPVFSEYEMSLLEKDARGFIYSYVGRNPDVIPDHLEGRFWLPTNLKFKYMAEGDGYTRIVRDDTMDPPTWTLIFKKDPKLPFNEWPCPDPAIHQKRSDGDGNDG